MFRHLRHRLCHHAVLLAVTAALFLPNLGGPSLWDIDEGNNAQCAHEMLDANNWVVPTFNYQLRVDKPALLYWLQIGAYRLFGINEFAARLPSALAALLAVLLTYEMGRTLFGRAAGLLTGVILASAAAFCAAAHFANPDALLGACTVLTFFCCWRSFRRPAAVWFLATGVAMGLAVLAKGPVGVVLPAAAAGLFALCTGRWRWLLDRRHTLTVLAGFLVAAPWYIWVAADTKAEWLRGFWLHHNWERAVGTLEGHGGPFWYYLPVLALGLLPWSVFLGPALWYSIRDWRRGRDPEQQQAHVFLWCWFAVYFVFFSLAGTKLPNYILPLYPAAAVLTARFLDGWRLGTVRPPAWVPACSLACLALVGVGVGVGFGIAGGMIRVPRLPFLPVPGLAVGAVLGVVPVLGAVAAGWSLWRQRRGLALASVAAAGCLLIGTLAAWGSSTLEERKAPRLLARAIRADQPEPEIRVGCHRYFQPSLVFYCGREVQQLGQEQDVLDFLLCPRPVYLIVPAPFWESFRSRAPQGCRVVERQYDLYCNGNVVVVANR
jgi:4-amino-4-deoxy-L-arabinose transferase-like glycosyltransferase